MNVYLENCKEGDRIKFVNQWHYKNHGTPNETKKLGRVIADRFPHFLINLTNQIGIVVEDCNDDYNNMMMVKLEKKTEELEEWDNEVYFYEDDLQNEILVKLESRG
jgi:hypothetical protein